MNEYHEPPDLTGKELDFSQFHPLDHGIWSKECPAHYGGRAQHLSLTWEYRWSEELRARTICLVGRHRRVTMHGRDDPGEKWAWVQDICRDCGRPLSERQST